MKEKIVVISYTTNVETGGLLKLVLHYDKFEHRFVSKFLYKHQKNVGIIPLLINYLFINADTISLSNEYIPGNWDIIIISDQMATEAYTNSIFDENTFILHHRKPENIKEYLKPLSVKGFKQGYHGAGNHGFTNLIDIISAYDEQIDAFDAIKYQTALNKFIKWFGQDEILEAKLLLLHNCLSPDTTPNHIPTDLKEENDTVTAFEEFVKAKNTNTPLSSLSAFDENHIDALEKLSLVLLSQY